MVVEAVADLVADHPADAAIVHRRVGVRIEEGRLQDRRREDDLVVGRVVIGVHRLRRHAPFVLVDRPVHAVQLELPAETPHPLDVSEQVVGADFKTRIVAPFVRIADLDGEFRQLLLGGGLGRVAHPGQVVDAVRQRQAQVGDQLLHLGLGLGREIAFGVHPAGGVAQGAFGEADGALFAGPLFRLARQVAAAELPLGVREAARQARGGVIDGVEGLPGLDHRHRRLGVDGGDLGHGRVLAHDQAVDAAQARGVQVAGEIKAGSLRGQAGRGVFVIGPVAVAVLDRGPVGLCDLVFESHDRRRVAGRIVPADHSQHPLDIGLVFLFLVRVAGVQIVVAVRQTQPALAHRGDIFVGAFGIDRDAGAEDRRSGAALRRTHIGRHALMGVGGADGGQIGLQRLGVQRLDPRLVHIAAIGVGHLGLVRAGRQVVTRDQFVDHGLDAVVRQFAQHGEGAVAGAVRRDLDLVEGQAAGVAEEVVAGVHRGVASRQVEAPGPVGRRGHALPARRRRIGVLGQAREITHQADDRTGLVQAGVVMAGLGRGGGGNEQGAEGGAGDEQAFHAGLVRFTDCGRRHHYRRFPRRHPKSTRRPYTLEKTQSVPHGRFY